MKKIKYILIFILSVGMFNSCLIDDETDIDGNDAGYNVVTFLRPVNTLSATADGTEVDYVLQFRIVGPTLMELTNDITVTFTPSALSTAVEGEHYRLNSSTFVLTNATDYLGEIMITLITDGNTPPLEDSPEFENYVAPLLDFEINATGDSRVVGSGKAGHFTLNFIAPNPYAGDYNAHILYWHPDAGDYPPVWPGTGQTPRFDEVNLKTLSAVTSRQCETWFGIDGWQAYLAWITVNADNTIDYVIDEEAWGYETSLGDPANPTLVSYFDPASRVIFITFNYTGASGTRIFWETYTPLF